MQSQHAQRLVQSIKAELARASRCLVSGGVAASISATVTQLETRLDHDHPQTDSIFLGRLALILVHSLFLSWSSFYYDLKILDASP